MEQDEIEWDGGNKADKSALNKDDTNFVKVDWTNSDTTYETYWTVPVI